jgi:hypothetical protein
MFKTLQVIEKHFKQNPDEFMSILKKKYIYVMNEGYENIPDVSYL